MNIVKKASVFKLSKYRGPYIIKGYTSLNTTIIYVEIVFMNAMNGNGISSHYILEIFLLGAYYSFCLIIYSLYNKYNLYHMLYKFISNNKKEIKGFHYYFWDPIISFFMYLFYHIKSDFSTL